MPVASLLREFNTNHAVQAVDEHGVIHVRQADEPADVRAFLERPVLVRRAAESTGAFFAVLEWLPDALLGRLRGAAGSRLGGDPPCPWDEPVRVPRDSPSVLSYLDAIVKQAPGTVWLVIYDDWTPPFATPEVGMMCTNGEYALTSIIE